MALDKAVDSAQLDAHLESVADAIREKGGTSAQLAFPADFVSAIEAISGGESYTLLASGTYTVTAAADSMTIPIGTINGTIKCVTVETSDTRDGTYAWAMMLGTAELTSNLFRFMWQCKYSRMAEWGANSYADRPILDENAHTFTVKRYSGSYNIKAATYNWYVYGEAST